MDEINARVAALRRQSAPVTGRGQAVPGLPPAMGALDSASNRLFASSPLCLRTVDVSPDRNKKGEPQAPPS
jgi:hypothetical protein